MNSVPSKARRAPRPTTSSSAGSRQTKKTTKASQPLSRHQRPSSARSAPRRKVALLDDFSTKRNGGLARMKEVLIKLTTFITSDPHRQPSPRIIAFLKRAQHHYDLAVRASIGMPGFSDCVTTQTEGPKDIPTVPLSGFQLIKRICYVAKLASSGTTAGGFFASLIPTDLGPFVGTAQFFRISKITSWTVPRADGNVNQGTFAGVSVPVSDQSQGTEGLPIWSENFTPVGQGFASIVTHFPLGDFPQYVDTNATALICNHYTSLGGTGGITGIPVIFHVEIETLI